MKPWAFRLPAFASTTFAIRWLKAGGDIYRLSRHLGHTSVKTTESYLSALTADELDHVLHVGTKVGTEAP
ncbi:phage integrase [Komagataeibacter medellinensis NBRC 3288]|uniref:Phage integrase n=1 Tax=Komagataeibacter medellinensis (strain NBRC 3288 / BCRC 11682 / LMG 1693 / Kondo 51) TaxID=634177 RepID=G2I568_KOMMN|nr:phage integrase [Komagataeibacter medellinensis NBRC 3288]